MKHYITVKKLLRDLRKVAFVGTKKIRSCLKIDIKNHTP